MAYPCSRFQPHTYLTRLLKLLITLTLIQNSTSTCYTPDKTIATDTPCQNGTDSACCSADSYCLSSGYCMVDMVLSRGSCTDSSWKSPQCPQHCQQINPGGGSQLASCFPDRWSCDPSTCLTSNFTLPNGALLLQDAQKSSLGVSTDVTTMTATNSLACPTALNNDITATSTITISALSTAAVSSDNNTNELSKLRFRTGLVIVGVSIGIPLAMACLTLALMPLRQKHRCKALAKEKSHLKASANFYKGVNAEGLELPREIGGGEAVRVHEMSGAMGVHEKSATPRGGSAAGLGLGNNVRL